MATPFNEIYDLFMMTCTDYRLDTLYLTSIPDFENYLESWLIYSITDFNVCDQSLITSGSSFTVDLTTENKTILATLMMKYWMQKNANDITQMNLHVTDRDFKIPSEAPNIREKTNQLNVVKEMCSQMLIDYAYRRVDWATWYNQDFSGL